MTSSSAPQSRQPAPPVDASAAGSSPAGGPIASTAGLRTLFEHEPQQRAARGYTVFLGLAMVGICIAVITPVMASMTYKLQHITSDATTAATQLGIILGIGALFALVTNPLVGRLSDRTTSRFGMRRPWIIGGSVVGLAALVGIGLAPNALVVGIFWCAAQMALNASLAALTATVADQVPVAQRGRVSGIVGLSIPLSIVTGTALVSVLPTDVLRFGVPGAIAVLVTAVFACFLRDRVLTEKPREPLGLRQIVGAFAFSPRRHPDFGWTWLSKFLVMFGYAGIATFFPLFLAERFALDEGAALQVIVVANLISTVATVAASPLAGWLSDRLRRRRVFVAAAGVVMVFGLVLLAFAPSIAVVFVAQGVIGMGAGSFTAVDLALGTEVLPNKEDTAKDIGVLTAANSLPQSIAPAIAPLVIGLGSMTAIGGYPTWYLFGALVALSGAVVVYRVRGVR